jgi:N6-adenosine-specific RNA methylase IME4
MVSRKPFGCIVADPPWKFGDKLPGKGRGAAKHYGCLTVSEIMRYPLPKIADDAILFLWRVASMQQEALDVARFWGFTVKSEIAWIKHPKALTNDQILRRAKRIVKHRDLPMDWLPSIAIEVADREARRVRIGMGRTARNAHEVCLVCTRGRPVIHDHSVSSVIFAPRLEHSRKPEELQNRAERLAGPVQKLELFARRYRDGWTCIGDQLPEASE